MPPNIPYQHKTFKFSIKAVDDEQGLIEAYGSVFNNVDQGDDIVRPGAFSRTIQESKARIQVGKAKFLAVMLWNHDPNQPIGGWYDMQEDARGLLCKGRIILTTSRGRDIYELIKAGVINEFSIGYDIYQGGANYDKAGNRNLTALRLWEVSPVTFAMNNEALLVGVKSVCGDTGLPIGPRNESWDGGEAHTQIVKWASDSDGNIDAGKMKQVHLRQNGDPDKITSYSYPFCYIVDGAPRISVGGVIACANALAGARNADPGDDAAGMRAKVATLYGRINKKYPDATPLTPPWDDSGKAGAGPAQRKTFQDYYAQNQAGDLLEDWSSVLLCSLTNAVFDAFQGGVSCNLADYLGNDGSAPAGYAGMMSRRNHMEMEQKHGRAISAANAQIIQGHIDAVHDMANKAMDAMKEHVKALHSAADDLATVLQGSEAAYGTDRGTADNGEQEGKSFNVPTRPRAEPQEPPDEDILAALTRLRSIKQTLN